MTDKQEYSISFYVSCHHPPYELGEFGLQDKAQQLHPPVKVHELVWEFQCQLRVSKSEKTGMPKFRGNFVQGTSDKPFLYLSLRERNGVAWIRRIKVPLHVITWEQVRALTQTKNGKFLASIDGTKSGTVELLSNGWQIIEE
jgi:hypothetical protein